MDYKHKADVKIAKWLDDLVEEKFQKKASSINTTMLPYGLTERASQLKNSVIDNAIEMMEKDSGKIKGPGNPDGTGPFGGTEKCPLTKEEDEKEEEMQDNSSTDIEKRIEKAKTPEELEKIEKELGEEKSPEEKPSEEKSPEEKPSEEKPPEEKPSEEKSPEEKPSLSGGTPEVEQLKTEIKKLKEQVDELTGEEKLQREIDTLKKRLDNIVVQDQPDLNQSIFQEAEIKSKIAYFKRCLRRIGKQ